MVEFTLVGARAITHIHVGEGQSRGAIDLPVAREQSHGLPILPGSSIKGALRSLFADASELGKAIFGPGTTDADSGAGAALFGDAQLLALPVRSDGQPFMLVTAPCLLDRLDTYLEATGNDSLFGGNAASKLGLRDGGDRDAVFTSTDTQVLEDLKLDKVHKDEEHLPGLCDRIAEISGANVGWLESHLVVVRDDIFRWLASYALPVRARNSLDDNKTVKTGALWYEETLPPDTLLATLWGERRKIEGSEPDPLKALWGASELKRMGCDRVLQVGGNETVGQGWLRLHGIASCPSR